MTTMTIHSNTSVSANISQATDFNEPARKRLKTIGNHLALAYTIYNERKALLKLSDETLADIGLTRAQAHAESKRSPFDIPANRM